MKYRPSTFIKQLENELHNHILPFWMRNMFDRENKGFIGRIDGNNVSIPQADKGSVLNARILWTFSAAFNQTHEEEYLKMANLSYDYCTKYFINQKNQGVYWLLDHKGNPVDKKNQIYALAFMIYGLSEYYRATGFYHAMEYAANLFKSIEKYSFDKNNNGYFEAFDENWELLEDLRLSSKDANEKKTMNTHLHILEAYTNLYREWDDPVLLSQIKNLICLFMEKILDTESYHFKLFFDEKWNTKGDIISFGHDIEGSWLLQDAAEVSKDEDLIRKTREITVKMVNATINEGFDEDGGLFYEADTTGIIDTDKHWWPQAEAMVGLINVWQITGKKNYYTKAFEVWQFIKENIRDRKSGEWFYRISREGEPYLEEDKAGFWKCPYHNSRACMEIIRRISTVY